MAETLMLTKSQVAGLRTRDYSSTDKVLDPAAAKRRSADSGGMGKLEAKIKSYSLAYTARKYAWLGVR